MKYLFIKLLFVGILIHPALYSQENTFKNPIISGFNPDPSICRVGSDFYLVTSSFEYFPGIPIYHSKDLINWNLIGNVLNRPSQLNLDSTECSQGIYAPTIRYNNGTFYMITTLVNADRFHFVVTAKNPAGPWSEPNRINNAPGIDPDLFFDDNGKVYMSGTEKNKAGTKENNIWIQEIDIKNWILIGQRNLLVNYNLIAGKNTPLESNDIGYLASIEGAHLYKKNGWYYSTFSHGGTGYLHAVSVFRSRNILGPYEGNPANPILTHRDLPNNSPVIATGHADLFEYDTNKWGIVYLIKRQFPEKKFFVNRFLLGRETALSLVDWSGDWPVVNPKGRVKRSEEVLEKPALKAFKVDKSYLKDDFSKKNLHPQWVFKRTPHSNWWSLLDKKGFLRVKLRPEVINDKVNPSFICKRQEHPEFTVTSKLKFSTNNSNEEAGLMLQRERNSFIKFVKSSYQNEPVLKVVLRCYDMKRDSLIAQIKISNDDVILKMDVQQLNHSFSYSINNGKNWMVVKNNIDLTDTNYINSGRFTGPMIGMYASSNGKPSSNYAAFDFFNHQSTNSKDIK